jgi:glycosyltransferase involved in cell wall biosynthesis
MNQIEFSILISAYNAEEYLRESILSALDQESVAHEVLVMDDGSSDSTLAILREFEDPRLRVYSRQNEGKAKSINELARLARGKYIAIQDADDLSTSNRLLLAKNAFNSFSPPDALLSGHSLIINKKTCVPNGKNLDWKECRDLVLRLRLPAHDPTLICRKDLFLSHLFNEELRLGQGVDLIFRLAESSRVEVLAEQLYLYRIHMGSITKNKRESNILRIQRIFKEARQRQRAAGLISDSVSNPSDLEIDSDGFNNLFGTFTSSVTYSLKRKEYSKAFETSLISIRYLKFGPRYAKPIILFFAYPILSRFKTH